MKARGLLIAGALLVAVSGVLLGNCVWMAAKARLAEVLISEAFAAHLADGQAHPPWSWADLSPTAELRCERLGVKRHVLTGGSGSSMAFGLGHLDGTAPPNGEGNCVLVGHRDGACAFLEDLRLGDRLTLRTRGDERTFVVTDQIVVSERNRKIIEPSSRSLLTLITCYPFGGLRTTPWRYVVVCERDPRDRRTSQAG
ncbi:class GN sortase [bacterium]|nr:class GN sortase [bacterium]